jgi:adenylate cyclase
VKARVARFVLGHVDWFHFGIPLLVALAASRVSILLGIVLALLCLGAFERLLHNANFLTAWIHRDGGDRILFEACRAGAFAVRRRYRWIPADPRCRLCLVPFGGVGKLVGIQPSQKNPEFCRDCIDASPVGTYEREVGVLFADIRGFTGDTEKRSPGETAASLTRFYALASRVLTQDDALVEMVGDQVMALYLADFPSLRDRTGEVMVAAARRLLAELDLPVGVGMHFGIASVGNVAKGKTKDFTAIGDVVNTAARLQGCARAGQIVVSSEIHQQAKALCADAEPVSLSLKGKAEPVRAYVLRQPESVAGRGEGTSSEWQGLA